MSYIVAIKGARGSVHESGQLGSAFVLLIGSNKMREAVLGTRAGNS